MRILIKYIFCGDDKRYSNEDLRAVCGNMIDGISNDIMVVTVSDKDM